MPDAELCTGGLIVPDAEPYTVGIKVSDAGPPALNLAEARAGPFMVALIGPDAESFTAGPPKVSAAVAAFAICASCCNFLALQGCSLRRGG